MTGYHFDARCGSCRGFLEVDRDAICHTCAPQFVWFSAAHRRHDFFLLGMIFLSAAAAAVAAWIIWGLL